MKVWKSQHGIEWQEFGFRLTSEGLPIGHLINSWVTWDLTNLSFSFLSCKMRKSLFHRSDQIRSVAQSCPTLCDPVNRSMPGLPVHHQLPEFTQTHVHRVSDAIQHLILCRPLLLLPPIPPSIRVFSNESTLHMRWPKYWNFSFSISPSKEIPGLIRVTTIS